MFDNNQMRTLELKGKNWGRFIRMRQADPRDTTGDRLLANSLPGINALTRNCKVTPGSQVDGLVSLCYKHSKNVHFALGYNIWARESEKVSLKDSWTAPGQFGLISANDAYKEEGTVTKVTGSDGSAEVTPYPALISQDKFPPASGASTNPWTITRVNAPSSGIAASMLPKVVLPESKATGISSTTTIDKYSAGDGATGTYIQASDVDTAAHASVMTHKFFAGLDFTGDPEKSYPWVLGVWGSYEFAQTNTGLDEWQIWAKIGMAF
jgi:hypothetical protein